MGDTAPAAPIRILHHDETLVAVSKPGGLIVHRTKESTDREFLLQRLASQVGQFLYPVHCLDRAASGVMVFARDSASARQLQASLTSAEARKEYLTLVRGSTPERFSSERPLTKRRGRRGRAAKPGDAVLQPAVTEFVKLAEFSRCSLLRARIFTGRRHQIRRHLAHLAHQILGDTTYGKGKINTFFRETYGLPRLFLHACFLEFRHPLTRETLRLEDPLASDLRKFACDLPDCDRKLIAGL